MLVSEMGNITQFEATYWVICGDLRGQGKYAGSPQLAGLIRTQKRTKNATNCGKKD